jgi:4-carboxymuconolactone decarboxylase
MLYKWKEDAMARIPIATRESVPENQRAAFDEVVQRTGSVPQHGPGSVMIHVPEAHRRATQLSNYLRNESSLPQKIQELAMLVTARELNCQHIWNAHATFGRRAGLSDALVNALRDRHDLPTLPPDEAAVVDYGQELFRTHHISRGAFQAALEQFGIQGLVELTMLMGYYGLLAFNVNAFDTDLLPERTELLLRV